MNTIETVISQIQSSNELQDKLAEAVKTNRLEAFLKELDCEGTTAEFIAYTTKPHNGELSDAGLDTVVGGTDGFNPGWAYGPCRKSPKCSGTRSVMQLNYKNLIVCTTCNDWVEF